jgi:hypothetical protein
MRANGEEKPKKGEQSVKKGWTKREKKRKTKRSKVR